MSPGPPLAVLFTMDCLPPARKRRVNPHPRTWAASSRNIDAFSATLLGAGHRPTLFCTLSVVANHTPALEEYATAGAEIGLLVDPSELRPGLRHPLGHYGRDDQREIVRVSVHRFSQLMGSRPRSVRTLEFSASDETFAVLRQEGFLQGSVSEPGRRVRQHRAVWDGAVPDPHLADPDNRLRAGSLEFLEIPITTDAAQSTGGVPPELNLDLGEFEKWHHPLADAQLERMERDHVEFRDLCWLARSGAPYGEGGAPCTRALHGAIEFVEALRDRFQVTSLTVTQAHIEFRRLAAPAC
ncbi:MAG: hypothetical protein J2P38_08300 [Candidatus Dormibacteraeota bacterium]|nr:hypothetical protein [Candidatus Dormibacteraeota bacterium]